MGSKVGIFHKKRKEMLFYSFLMIINVGNIPI